MILSVFSLNCYLQLPLCQQIGYQVRALCRIAGRLWTLWPGAAGAVVGRGPAQAWHRPHLAQSVRSQLFLDSFCRSTVPIVTACESDRRYEVVVDICLQDVHCEQQLWVGRLQGMAFIPAN